MGFNFGVLSFLVVALGCLCSSLANRLAKRLRFPPVVAMLACGIALRSLYSSDGVLRLTDPVVDIALAGIGLEIGSHLNQQTIGPVATQVLKFMMILCPIVVGVISFSVWALIPEMVPFCLVLGSMAVERSSPECLHGVEEARAKGPFSSTIVCIAALQDVFAVILFVFSSVALGATGLKDGVTQLSLLFVCTGVAAVAAVCAAHFIKDPVACLATICVLLTVAAEYTPSELLLSAIITGAWLHYNKPHPIGTASSDANAIVAVMLFTWMGYRIDIAAYIFGGAPILKQIVSVDGVSQTSVTHTALRLDVAFGLFLARLGALFIGSLIASYLSGMTQGGNYRWMGMVTQLAIALSLVQRGEALFPEGAPLFHAYGAAVMGSLASGPYLLQLALQRSGEAGKAEERKEVAVEAEP